MRWLSKRFLVQHSRFERFWKIKDGSVGLKKEDLHNRDKNRVN